VNRVYLSQEFFILAKKTLFTPFDRDQGADIEGFRSSAMYRTSNITNHHQCHEAKITGMPCSDLADLTMRDIVAVIYLTGSMGFSLSEALERTELYYAVPCGGITVCEDILKKWHTEAKDADRLINRRLEDLVYEAKVSFFGDEWIVFSAMPVVGAMGKYSRKNSRHGVGAMRSS
jgi:hypothetical protein